MCGRQLSLESVEPLPNSLCAAAAFWASGLIFGSGHWRCSISGRALKNRLVLKLRAHFSLGFRGVKEVTPPQGLAREPLENEP